MRARNRRRSVFNTISAAMLEVSIMGLFVILAQPQLRDALFELIGPEPVTTAASPAVNASALSSSGPNAPAQSASAFEQTVHAVLRSPVGQAFGKAIEDKLSNTDLRQVGDVIGLPLPSVSAQLSSTPLPATNSHATAPQWTNDDSGQRVARFAPLEQYESFRVSVPSAVSAHVPSMLPSTTSSPASTYAGITQLAPNQWNVGSAAGSNLPPVNYNSWAPMHSAQTSYREIYPPPYGTQSQWK